jgi:glutathione peroxidase
MMIIVRLRAVAYPMPRAEATKNLPKTSEGQGKAQLIFGLASPPRRAWTLGKAVDREANWNDQLALMKKIICAGAWLIGAAAGAASLYDLPLKDIDGKDTSLKPYQGKVLLIVNVASKCGLTPQYKALEALHRKYKDQGLLVLGFPCNQFGGQEPGTKDEIKSFCSTQYDVTFPLFEKLEVNGPGRHPLYATLAGKDSPFPGDIKWNFNKFLIGRDGKILKRFEPRTTPDAAEVIKAVEAALAAPAGATKTNPPPRP